MYAFQSFIIIYNIFYTMMTNSRGTQRIDVFIKKNIAQTFNLYDVGKGFEGDR